MLAVELLLFEWTPRSFVPVAVAAIVAELERTWLGMARPLFPFAGDMAIIAGLRAVLGVGRTAVGRAVGAADPAGVFL